MIEGQGQNQGQGHNLDLSRSSFSDEQHAYKLVGLTPLYQPHRLRAHSVALLPEQRVVVKRGDVIGVYFPQQNPIPWSATACHSSPQRYLYLQVSSFSHLSLGTDYMFSTALSENTACRLYSLRVVFGLSRTYYVVVNIMTVHYAHVVTFAMLLKVGTPYCCA